MNLTPTAKVKTNKQQTNCWHFLPFPLISVGKISAQPHTTLCIQFLNRENSDKNNTFPLGKQICFTIVWGCTETLPKIFYSIKRAPEMQSSSQIFFTVPAMEQEKLLGRRSVITIEPRIASPSKDWRTFTWVRVLHSPCGWTANTFAESKRYWLGKSFNPLKTKSKITAFCCRVQYTWPSSGDRRHRLKPTEMQPRSTVANI